MIQSVGRLIRSVSQWTDPMDTAKGIVVLVDESFADAQVNELLPDYWFQNPGDVVVAEKYEKEIHLFWKNLTK